MEILTQPTATPSNAAALPPSSEQDGALASDFQTFLQMLTTQMQNQDPLNPIDSADFAVQLATFSSVEQQVRTNDLLSDMLAGMGASGLAQMAGWVGMKAKVSAPANFQGEPIQLAPDPDPASDAAVLVVRNSAGQEVSREAVPLGNDTLAWAGVGSGGNPLPADRYTFQLESLNQGQITSVRPIAHYAIVREAQVGPNGVDIILDGGIRLPSTEVQALRQSS